jgi:hypothetical protein
MFMIAHSSTSGNQMFLLINFTTHQHPSTSIVIIINNNQTYVRVACGSLANTTVVMAALEWSDEYTTRG